MGAPVRPNMLNMPKSAFDVNCRTVSLSRCVDRRRLSVRRVRLAEVSLSQIRAGTSRSVSQRVIVATYSSNILGFYRQNVVTCLLVQFMF